MIAKYPNTWEATYLDSPFCENGDLTPIACEWSSQLSGIATEQIKNGIDSLAGREEKRFPPNAMEFKELCTGDEWDLVLDAIMCKLQEGSAYCWTNRVAFNVWYYFEHNPALNQTYSTIAKKCKKIFQRIDKTAMFDLPDYQTEALAVLPDINLRERIIFQKGMFNSINRINPDLWLNRLSTTTPPKKMLDIFSKAGTIKLMQKFKKGEDMDGFLKVEGIL